MRLRAPSRRATARLSVGALVLGVLAVVNPTPAVAATTFTVSTTADIAPNAGACGTSSITTPPSPLSLREATCLANNVGGSVVINVPAGTYTLTGGELRPGVNSGQSISIIGAGSASTVINGNNSSRILNIDMNSVGGVNANISNVTLTGARDTTYGGAAILDGSYVATTTDVLNLNSVVISNNTAVGDAQPGGGVQMYGGQLNVTNSTFTNNRASTAGSAIYYQAVGDASPEGLTITNSTFAGNSVNNTGSNGYSGGAVAAEGVSGSQYTIANSTFTGNTVTTSGGTAPAGGAIYQPSGNLTVTESVFTGNTASGTGASAPAIFSSGTSVLHYNRITGNTGTATVRQLSGSMDATNNWWGCNTGPNSAGCDTAAGFYTAAPRLVLTASASPAKVTGPNASATISGSLATNSANSSIAASDLDAFQSNPMIFSDPPGDATVTTAAGPQSRTVSAGAASIDYHSNTVTGANPVTVTFDNATVTTSVEVDQAPAVTSPNSATFAIGQFGSVTITTTGYPVPGITRTGALPAGLTFTDNGDGTATIAGTPTSGGTYALSLTANNGINPNATQTLTLSVGQPPAFTSPATATLQVGAAGTFTVTTSGIPTVSTITESGTLPAGVTFTDNGNGTATIAGTPTGTGGTYPVTLTATNGVAPNATQSLTVQVDQAPSITLNPSDQTVQSGTSVTFSAGAAGVPTPTVQWQVSTGNGFGNIAGATSPSYTHTATAGEDGNRYRAVFTNRAGTATTSAATLHVGTAPAFTSADHTEFRVGAAGSFTVTTTGMPNATLSRTGAQFPAWLTLTDNGDGTGTLTGTPPAGSGGVYGFTLKAANGFAPSASQNFTLVVNQSPVITSADHATFTAGTAGSFAVTTTPGYPLTTTLRRSGALPAGVSFTDNGDGTATLYGTPAATSGGTYSLTFTAGNGSTAPDVTQSFVLTVNAAPRITSADHKTFAVGTAGSFTVTTADAHPAATTVTLDGSLPAGLSFADNGDGTATIAGTPNAGAGGVYSLTLSASNGIAPDATQSFTLTVNEAPVITSADHATFVRGTAEAFTVTTDGAQPSATTITETGALPAGVTFTDNGDGTATLAGTPTERGAFPITLTAANGVLPDATQNFTLSVNETPAFTSADHVTFAAGSAHSFTVTTSAGFPAARTIARSGALPTGVSFTDNGDGTATIAGTPAAGTGAAYPLTLTAGNGVLPNATQAFTLTVTEAPHVTSVDHATFAVGTSGQFTVTTAAGYPTATSLAETGSLPAGLTFTDNGDGSASLTGTPAAGTGGQYPLTLTATNSAAHTDQSFTLTVNESTALTSADHATFATGDAGTFTVTTAGGYPTPPTLSSTGTLPSGVTFTDNGDGTATLAGTPAATAGGSYPLTLTASNGHSADAFQAFTLTVTQPSLFTSADHATFSVGVAGSFTVTTSDGFPPARSITESGTLPSGVTFTDNGDGTATLSGTPASNTNGSYPVTIAVTNADGRTEQSFTLTVGKRDQTISKTAQVPSPAVVGGGYTPSAVATSGLPVTIALDTVATTNSACSLANGKVSFDHVGHCRVNYTQGGDGTWSAAPAMHDDIDVVAITTTVQVSPQAGAVYGQDVHVTATVKAGSTTPAGTVRFGVDGKPVGSPVTVDAQGGATSPALVDASGHPLEPGSHQVTADFTPTDATRYATGTGSVAQVVDQAATTTTLAVKPSRLVATVAPISPGAGEPSGTVVFSVAGKQVGSAPLVSGVATLDHSVAAGAVRTVAAKYSGDTRFTASSDSVARHDPTITASVRSSTARTKYGWYRSPVTVSFRCATGGAPLIGPCPAPVTLTRSAAAQSVTRTIAATDGGMDTVTVRGIDIDRVRPAVRVTGVRDGATYYGTAPKAGCKARDSLSGVASCRLALRSASGTTVFRVTATDRAGNVTVVRGSYRTSGTQLQGATFTDGAWNIKPGRTYTLVVHATARPVYYYAAVHPRTPGPRGPAFHRAGKDRWTLGVTMDKRMGNHRYWDLGVLIGKTLHRVKVRTR